MKLGNGYNIKSTKLNINFKKSKASDVIKNLDDSILYQVGYMMSGKSINGNEDLTLGKNYFVKNGKCDQFTSDPECAGEDKYTYVRNIGSGNIPPMGISFHELTGCNLNGLTEMRGIVPSMIEDVYDINPYEISKGILGKDNLGSNTCKSMTLPVGRKIYNSGKEGKTWNMETKCTASHHTRQETSDQNLNDRIKDANLRIDNASMPYPNVLSEKFKNKTSYRPGITRLLFIITITLFIVLALKTCSLLVN
tara:strand:- start:163 stop:915 length:753 start_codon:yes stop_codon:yes gene_type:complete